MPMERIVFTLLGLRRHWLLLLLPLVIAAPIAVFVMMVSPKKYEARSTVLMISANRGAEWAGGAAGFPRQHAVEQVAVLEAWLKSEHVLTGLLPQLFDGVVPTRAEERSALTTLLRRSLTLQLIGAGVLEVQLQGDEANGLGRKLEIIVTRLMEGVLNPEAGILSAPQLIVARRRDAVTEADAALARAIAAARLDAPDQVKSRLQTLFELKRKYHVSMAGSPGSVAPAGKGGSTALPPIAIQTGNNEAGAASAARQIEDARAIISSDPEVVKSLERLFDVYEEAQFSYREVRERTGPESTSYVRVFDAPERLTVIGRPQDPRTGTSSGWKYAVVVLFLGCLASLGLVGLAMVLDTRLRIGEDFEHIAEVPVVARLSAARLR